MTLDELKAIIDQAYLSFGGGQKVAFMFPPNDDLKLAMYFDYGDHFCLSFRKSEV